MSEPRTVVCFACGGTYRTGEWTVHRDTKRHLDSLQKRPARKGLPVKPQPGRRKR